MSDDDLDVEDLKKNWICVDCVGEDFLRAEIERLGTNEACSYCDSEEKTISLEDFSDYIDTAFEQHYHRTSPDPEDGIDWLMAKEGNWERAGERSTDAIGNAARIDEDPAEHVRQILSDRHYDHHEAKTGAEGEFDEDAHYEEGPVQDYELQAEWQHFQKSLQTESRLFNSAAAATLDSVFEKVEEHKTHDGRSAIVDAGPGKPISALYRARVFQSGEKLEDALKRPDRDLGPPPPKFAMAGRMNARGIAVFYGATDSDVALAETRPPVGSKVAVARFEITRPLRLLDIEVLREIFVEGSIFDSSFLGRLEKAKFLRTVSHRITAPVMPDDELFDYLVTQAIADYLAGRSDLAIDGIIYPSVQDGGNKKNIVLLHKAARVENLDLPAGTEISSFLHHYDEDGESPDYSVHEEVPPAKKEPEKHDRVSDFIEALTRHPGMPRDDDTRPTTLKIDLDSIEVNHIQNVSYGKKQFGVRRHRSEKREPTFARMPTDAERDELLKDL
ncbi:MAG: RES family NAD+ phosphorylase [Pseudomonadota bacterium]